MAGAEDFLDAVAKFHGRRLYETPVGFNYIGELIKENRIIIGGEESAGLTIKGHVPRRTVSWPVCS